MVTLRDRTSGAWTVIRQHTRSPAPTVGAPAAQSSAEPSPQASPVAGTATSLSKVSRGVDWESLLSSPTDWLVVPPSPSIVSVVPEIDAWFDHDWPISIGSPDPNWASCSVR